MTENFSYVGRNQQGEKVSGVLKAENVSAAAIFLQTQSITPLNIEPAKAAFDFKKLMNMSLSHKVDTQELLSFCRGIAALDETGVPLVAAISQLSLSCASQYFAQILQEIADNISAGKTLANALRNYPKVFSPLFTNIVEISENTGNIGKAFLQLASYTEMSLANSRRLKSSVRYPLTVVCIAVLGCMAVNVMVLPKFAGIFAQYKGTLPLPTRVLMGFSSLVINHWFLLVLGISCVIFGIPRLFKIDSVKMFWDRFKLKLPILGPLQSRIMLFQFTWTFALILRSGMPLIKGLGFAAGATGNAYFNQQILQMCRNIEKGESLATSATITKLFPPSVLQMLSVGEESGRLDDILQAITGYYEREVDYDIKRLNDLLEPILMVLIGGMVLTMALAIYLPLWQLIDISKTH